MCQVLHNTQFSQSDFNLSERLTGQICRLNDCSDGKFLRLPGRLFHNFNRRYLKERFPCYRIKSGYVKICPAKVVASAIH